jgi:hypothetical protein
MISSIDTQFTIEVALNGESAIGGQAGFKKTLKILT